MLIYGDVNKLEVSRNFADYVQRSLLQGVVLHL